MIQIDRGPRPAIPIYVDKTVDVAGGTPLTKAEDEQKRAEKFFTDPNNYLNNTKLTKEKFNFAVYREAALRGELDRVFQTKCAYCESNFGAVMPKDVEHFRPKSEIRTGMGDLVPGYYWLAAAWDNLLASCGDCNRGRKLKFPDEPTMVKRGKATQFPLSDETVRVRGPGTLIATEDPVRLLIDPCSEDPSPHLSFDEKGLVRGLTDKGKASVIVYALQRAGLVDVREKRRQIFVLLVRELIKALGRFSRLSPRASAARRADELETITEFKARIGEMLAPGAEYLGMLREWIRNEKAAGRLDTLTQAKIDLESPDLILH